MLQLKHRSALANCLQFTLQIYVRLCCRQVLPLPMIKSPQQKTFRGQEFPFRRELSQPSVARKIYDNLITEPELGTNEVVAGGKSCKFHSKMLFWHEASSI